MTNTSSAMRSNKWRLPSVDAVRQPDMSAEASTGLTECKKYAVKSFLLTSPQIRLEGDSGSVTRHEKDKR
jgi:hypothetical protein